MAAIGIFELFESLCEALPGQVRDEGHVLDLTMLEPYGVVDVIVPFNWPPIHTASKLAPALAVGNAVVIKPPEQAPLSALRLVEIVQTSVCGRVPRSPLRRRCPPTHGWLTVSTSRRRCLPASAPICGSRGRRSSARS